MSSAQYTALILSQLSLLSVLGLELASLLGRTARALSSLSDSGVESLQSSASGSDAKWFYIDVRRLACTPDTSLSLLCGFLGCGSLASLDSFPINY